MNPRLLIPFVITVSLLTGCAAGNGEWPDRLSLITAFRYCRRMDEGQECFENRLGKGLRGVTKYGDVYEAWEATEQYEDPDIGGYMASRPEFYGYGIHYIYKTCKLEINFRNNKIYKYQFTGDCGQP